MQAKDRAQLYQGLKKHFGSMKEVAKRARVHRNYVSAVLKGDRNSDKVLLICSKVLLEREKTRSTKRQQIDRNINEAIALTN